MVATDVLRAGLLALMALLVAAGVEPVVVYALSIVGTVVGTAFRPAQAALVPSLARTPEELTAANVTASTIESVGIFVGPALGGLLVAATNVETTFLATGVLLIWSAVLVGLVREPARERRAEHDEPTSFLRESVTGFRVIVSNRRLALLTSLFAAQTFVDGALGVLLVVLALETLDLGASGVGFLNSVLGVGGIVGGVAAALLVARARLGSDFGAGIVLWGVPLVVVGIWPEPAVVFAAFALVGIANTVVDVSGDTLLQRSVPEKVLSRAFAAMESVTLVAVALGSIAAPILVDALGDRVAIAAIGALLPSAALFAWRSLAALDRPPSPDVELLRSIPLFAPLPPATVEYLAQKLARRRLNAGETVIRTGERGDSFYVVADGAVEVTVDGTPPRTLGAGDFFGEIALLRDVPRTATVVARDGAEVLELAGEDFVAAVTGHADALRVADAVVGARLAPA
jgi:predicted MFS family arabinose efflux permease